MECRLGDIAKVNRGASPRPIIEYLDKTGYPWLKISDFKLGDKYVYNTKEFIKKEGLHKTRYVAKGTLILTNSATPGIPIFIGKDMCLHDGFLYFTEVNEKILNKEYLYYYFLLNRKYIVNNANGSVFKNLKKEIVENIILELPQLDEQLKIVEILNNINKKIEINKQINNNLYEIIKQYIENKYNSNPKIKKDRVSLLGKIQGGYAFKSKDLIDNITNNKIFKIKNISSSGIDIENTQFIYDEIADKVDKKFLLNRGDVIIAMTGAELGKAGYLYGEKDRYFLNQRVGVVRGKDKFSDLYLRCVFLLDGMQSFLNSKGYGSAQPNISASNIENIEISIPNEKELRNFYNIAEPIYNKMIYNSEEIKTLEQLGNTLLPKLMNGEIDLDKIEI